MLKLAIHRANELDRNVKATVQSSGRLGFSEGAYKKLGLEAGKHLIIATNENDEKDENLYAWLEEDEKNGGFRINKAGEYYNVNTKPLFDKLNINYRDKKQLIIYDIVDFDYDGNKIYKFIKRVHLRNTRNKKTGEADN